MGLVKAVKLTREEAEFIDDITEGLSTSDVLRAGLDLLLSLVFLRKPNPNTIALIFTIRGIANRKNYAVSNCLRIVIDLYGQKVYCT